METAGQHRPCGADHLLAFPEPVPECIFPKRPVGDGETGLLRDMQWPLPGTCRVPLYDRHWGGSRRFRTRDAVSHALDDDIWQLQFDGRRGIPAGRPGSCDRHPIVAKTVVIAVMHAWHGATWERANLGSLLVQECFHLVKGAGRIFPETRRLAPKPVSHIR